MSLSKMAKGASSITESKSSDDSEDESQGSLSTTLDLPAYLDRLQRRLKRAIIAQRELLANNPASGVPSSPNPDTGGFMQCYHDAVVRGKHSNVGDVGDKTAELYVATNLLANLKLENDQMERLVDKIQKDIKHLDDEYAEQDDQIKTLQEIMEQRKTIGDMAQETTLEAKLKKAKQLFLLYRTAVDEMITECFANRDDRIKDILQDMCKLFFEGSVLYTHIHHDSEIIGLLVDAKIIKRHPHDTKLFRLSSEY